MNSITKLTLCLTFMATSLLNAQEMNKPPVLLAKKSKDKKSTPLIVSKFSAEVVVTGNTAETTMTMTFQNDTDRVLEGELVFPLNQGTTVSGYSLEVNGKMREGVVVEKNFARTAYEDTIRKEIDPGLVEWTKGNNFRTRIYPIPAKGTKTVSISYEETLRDSVKDEKSLAYSLPLAFGEKIDDFQLKIKVVKPNGEQKIVVENNAGLDLKLGDKKHWALEAIEKGFVANQTLKLNIPKESLSKVTSYQAKDSSHYFYIIDDKITPQKAMARPVPKQVKIIWDASHSGAQRDVKQELAVLKRYLSQTGIESVSLDVVRNVISPMGAFTTDEAGLNKLFNAISSLRYDGATRLDLVELTKVKADAIVIVSDGITTIGKNSDLLKNLGEVPVFTLYSSQSAEHAFLKSIALRTQGARINLATMDAEAAHALLTQQTFSLLSVTGKGITQTYPSVATPVSGTMSVSGILDAESAEVTLNYGVAGKVTTKHTFKVGAATQSAESGRIARLWAQKKLADLELEPQQNEEAIVDVAKAHGIVTRYTSLLVLDRMEDYVRYAIAPPEPELRKEYERLLKEVPDEKEADADFRVQLLNRWQEMVAWHDQKSPAFEKLLEKRVKEIFITAEKQRDGLKNMVMKQKMTKEKRDAMMKRILPLNALLKEKEKLGGADLKKEEGVEIQLNILKENKKIIANLMNTEDSEGGSDPFSEGGGPPELPNQVAPSGGDAFDGGGGGDPFDSGEAVGLVDSEDTALLPALSAPVAKKQEEGGQPQAEIKLQKWNPDTPYLKELRQAVKDNKPVDELEDVYFNLKKDYLQNSGFYLDVAQFFAEQKQEEIALRMLSTVAELDMENPALLRILAHRYDQLGHYDLAELIFREVLALRDEEPQSYRDLALVLEKKGELQEAADLLWEVSMSLWHGRMEGIQLIALTELNALIAKNAEKVKTEKFDSRFIHNLDCDMRIVLTWDADNTDMDLWVTDLLGEQCNYGYNLTTSGGRMSNDMTEGYGPEVFLIKKALPGNYQVKVDYYGNNQQNLAGETTIQATLITNWGRANEKRKAVTLRLKDEASMIEVGDLEFK